MIRAVLFDFYDTLAHVDGERILAGRRALAERAGVDEEAMAALWRETAPQRMLGALGTLEDEIAAMLARLGVEAAPALLAELARTEVETWQQAVALYPDALPALEALKARGYRLGILSNCSYQAGYVIEQAGPARLFDDLTLSFRVQLAKPAPAIYEHACRALDVSYAQAAFVADGAFGELDAACDLGITAVLVEQARQSRAYGGSERWDYRVTCLAAVPPLLERLAAHGGEA